MSKKMTPVEKDLLLNKEIEELRRELQLAKLKIEGYQVMGDILKDEFGIDLLKKLEAKQSQYLKKITQK